MLNQEQLAALLLKIAVSTSLASIVMRFGPMQRMLLRDDRTLRERLQLAFNFRAPLRRQRRNPNLQPR